MRFLDIDYDDQAKGGKKTSIRRHEEETGEELKTILFWETPDNRIITNILFQCIVVVVVVVVHTNISIRSYILLKICRSVPCAFKKQGPVFTL